MSLTTVEREVKVAPSAEEVEQQRDQFIDRLLEDVSGVWSIFSVHIGSQLGYYDALARYGAQNSSQLALHTEANERYTREWLEQQTVAGILTCENPDASATERQFLLPAGHVEPLTETESLNYLGALPQIVVGAVYPLAEVIECFRNGGGVDYADFGKDLHEGQAGMNRNAFLYELGQDWLPSIQDIDERLTADPPARVADIGCGYGWSSIGMASAYPNARVDGFDLDLGSVAAARDNVAERGLEKRVNIQYRDAADPTLEGKYDLVTAFECVHDMSDPVGALRTMRRLACDTGSVIIMDERVGEKFTPEGNEVEWLMYGFSVFHCLPVGMVDQPSAGTGTVMRPDTLRGYAEEAGFSDFEILPIENYFFNFYRLTP